MNAAARGALPLLRTDFEAPAASQVRPAPEIVLDLSRLLSRTLHPTPTGIDRVEMAYANQLLCLAPERLNFAAIHPVGLQGRLSADTAHRLLQTTAKQWRSESARSGVVAWERALTVAAAAIPRAPRSSRPEQGRVYLHLSPRGLERRALFADILRREQARLVVFMHDLIPIEHPEYARPGGAALCQRKLDTVLALASGVIANSEATARALAPHIHRCGRQIAMHAAPLGADLDGPPLTRGPPGDPYFVVLGTIEPRKNHLMLLQVWRRLVELHGPAGTPKLVLIGRRGWENENILDLLDRCPGLKAVVEERSRLPDGEMRSVLAGARALLLPSFAEGFGLPVAEALHLGVPVLASDLPSLREAGDEIPDYIDPLDGLAWMRAILDHARPDSALRARQLACLARWQAPIWETHVKSALAFIDQVAA